MPEIEPDAPQPIPFERSRCVHDVERFRRFMPHGCAVGDGSRGLIVIQKLCPYVALPGSSYCFAHTVLNDAVTDDTRADIEDWIGRTLSLCARGLLINPPLPDGTLYYPFWWNKRFN